MLYRLPRTDICMSESMPFNQHWEARVPLPIAKIDDIGLALHAVYASFRVGDLVNVCAFESRSWETLIEVASFRVHNLDNGRIKVLQIGETVKVPKTKTDARVKPGEPLNVVPVNGTFEVRDGKGSTIETFVDRKQAEAFARRNGEPAAEKATAAA